MSLRTRPYLRAAFSHGHLGSPTLTHIDNLFLDALPREVLDYLTTVVERVTVPFRSQVAAPGERTNWVYFPCDCLLSVVASTREGSQIEIDAVGREGFTPVAAALDGIVGVNAATWCQLAGDAYRVPADVFSDAAKRFPALAAIMNAYASANLDVRAQSIVCSGLHHTTERCARWLLLTHDRVARDEFPLTHEVLSTMLGVRRAGVSLAAATLQNGESISYARGRFTIVDRKLLEAASCECYEAQDAIFGRHGLRSPRLTPR